MREESSSVTTTKGTATRANCFVRTAAASAAPAHPGRRLSASANARTSRRRVGASELPNQAALTTSGLAARNTPKVRRTARGPGKTRAALRSAIVVSAMRTRTSSQGSGRPPRRGEQCCAGKVREMAESDLSLDHVVRDASVEAVEALQARRAVVVPVRDPAVANELNCELELVRRVVREEPRRRGLAKPHLQQDCGNYECRDDREARGDEDPTRPAPSRHATTASATTPTPASIAIDLNSPRSQSESARRTRNPRGPRGFKESGRKSQGSAPSTPAFSTTTDASAPSTSHVARVSIRSVRLRRVLGGLAVRDDATVQREVEWRSVAIPGAYFPIDTCHTIFPSVTRAA